MDQLFTEWIPWWFRWQRICLQCRRPGFDPWVGEISWRREWQPIPVFLAGESHGERRLAGYSPRGRKQSGTTEQLTHSFPLNTTRRAGFLESNLLEVIRELPYGTALVVQWHHVSETIFLRLGYELMCWDSNPAKTYGLPNKIKDLVSGPNKTQVLDVSSQKEFSERLRDR